MIKDEDLEWYNQRIGYSDVMRKEVGNAFWNYVHTLAEWTPPSKEQEVYEVIKKNIEVFPCEKCSQHGLEYLEKHPFNPLIENLKIFLWRFHNDINRAIGKKAEDISILADYSPLNIEELSSMDLLQEEI